MLNNFFKNYKKEYLSKDILSGITVAALTIPTSMGYAQIAGLPPIYGLYAAVLPVIAYAIFASSPQMIVGLDASASAIAGSVIASVGLIANTDEAIAFAGILTFFTGLFIILFSVFKLHRFIVYVSEPVMAGVITGIAVTVAFSQIPKILGVSIEGEHVLAQGASIIAELKNTNLTSLAIGVSAVVIILVGKKFIPKVPLALVSLILFTVLTASFNWDQQNVVIVGEIPKGLPKVSIPEIWNLKMLIPGILGGALTATILAIDSLLTSKKFSEKNHYELDEKKEIFAFGMANLVSSFSGSAPINTSVSRTAANEQFKGKTQLVSIVAAVIIALILAFFSNLLFFMPQPVLSGIVFAAIIGVIVSELKFVKLLYRDSKRETFIWLMATFGVILSDVLIGLIIGIFLSFTLVIVARTTSSSAFLGKDPDTDAYIDLQRNPQAVPDKNILIYRYSNSLFFVNIGQFIGELQDQLSESPDIKTIIIESHAMTTIDITAAKKLERFLQELREDEIAYYFVNTIGDFRDAIQQHNLGEIISEKELLLSIPDAVNQVKR